MNVKENRQWFLWSVKNNKGKKKARKRKLFVVLGVSCKSALAELRGRRGDLRKKLWPERGVRRKKRRVSITGLCAESLQGAALQKGEGEGEDCFKQNDMSHSGVTSQQPGRHFCFDSRMFYIRFAILLKMKI